jgi:GR25 family glycosyltransferase involved in LPS biosynthesis
MPGDGSHAILLVLPLSQVERAHVRRSITRQAADLLAVKAYPAALEHYLQLRHLTKLSAWDYQIAYIRRQLLITSPSGLPPEQFADIFKSDLGIEHVYVLNLPQRTDRKERALKEFTRLGFSVSDIEFVQGVHGDSNETARLLMQRFKTTAAESRSSRLSIPESILGHDQDHATPGVFGYILSQQKIFSDALKRGFRRFAVFDDDVFFAPHASSVLYRFSSAKIRWEILLLGASNYFFADEAASAAVASQAAKLGFYHPVPFVTCGSFAMCYDHSIVPTLLELVDDAEGYFDRHMLAYLYQHRREKCFALSPPAFGADVTESDIRQPRNIHAHAQAMGWDASRFDEYRRTAAA